LSFDVLWKNKQAARLTFVAPQQKQAVELGIGEMNMAHVATEGVDVAGVAQIVGSDSAAALVCQLAGEPPGGL